ncbi:MAG: hypothetical protein JNJ75_13215 [Cyclobacteriaceae bacterium]|nr:hypothetical protein [Cyclobacteriaceae bacterium]
MNILNLETGFGWNLISINLFNFSNDKRKINNNQEDGKNEDKTKEISNDNRVYKDYKTTLGRWGIVQLNDITEDVNAYLFIEKEKDSSAWNLVAPTIHEKSTGRIYQYGLGYFSLEGCGGGLNNTIELINKLKELRRRGIKVNIVPKVVDNDRLAAFQYVDSGVTIDQIISNSIDLVNYDKGEFTHIKKTFEKILNE